MLGIVLSNNISSFQTVMTELEREAHRVTGRVFQLSSFKELAVVLYKTLKLPAPSDWRWKHFLKLYYVFLYIFFHRPILNVQKEWMVFVIKKVIQRLLSQIVNQTNTLSVVSYYKRWKLSLLKSILEIY